jgi:hypothetical protein
MHNAFAQTLTSILHHKGRTWTDVFKYRVLRKTFGAKREEVTISKLEGKKKIVKSRVKDMRLLQV